MKIGISVASAYNVTDVRQGARQMIDRASAAARANLDSLFVGDHHVVRLEVPMDHAAVMRVSDGVADLEQDL